MKKLAPVLAVLVVLGLALPAMAETQTVSGLTVSPESASASAQVSYQYVSNVNFGTIVQDATAVAKKVIIGSVDNPVTISIDTDGISVDDSNSALASLVYKAYDSNGNEAESLQVVPEPTSYPATLTIPVGGYANLEATASNNAGTWTVTITFTATAS